MSTTNGCPSVAVVILNYNGKNFMERFLPSVMSSRYENLSIIVADNGSTDDSIAYIKSIGYKSFIDCAQTKLGIIEMKENTGFAEGYNIALRQIKDAKYYVLLNSDVEVTTNWIEPIIELMESDPLIASCQPKILSFAEKDLFEYSGASGGMIDILGYPFCRGRIFETLEKDTHQYDETKEIFWASGAAMFVNAALFHKIGGLDGDYFAHMEEIDLCWRLKRAGYKVMAVPQSTVFHVGGGTLPKVNSHKTYLNFRNSLTSVLKNAPPIVVFLMVFLRLLLDGVAAARFLYRGEYGNIWAVLHAHGSFYIRMPKNIYKRFRYRVVIRNCKPTPDTPFNTVGLFQGSIVWEYFIGGRKLFSEFEKAR